MGQLVYIGAKKSAIDKLNKALDKMNIENSFTTEEDNINWLKDINENPESPQAHLKPSGRDLTMEELLRTFTIFTEVGLLTFDVAYSRTSEEEAQKYLAFIRKYKNDLEYLKGAQELIERYETTAEDKKVIKLLNVKDKEPEKLPKEQQTTDDLQGGVWLCKSWGLQPFWIIYGKVDRPKFLKRKIYVDDIHNNLYKDKKGYAYLLVPLMPFGGNQLEFANKVYEEATEMGLRESNAFIIPIIYGMNLVNLNDVATHFREFYTVDEIKERFMQLMTATSATFNYGGTQGFIWSDTKKMFKPSGWSNSPTEQICGRCSVLTSLLRALDPKIAAEVMSKMMNKTYKAFEFEIK